jgi:Lrp/AsnC family transcriptional regulator for asnA, asnC and gidA
MRDTGRGARLDGLDRAIISALQENARLTNVELAAHVNSTEPTVRRRVKRLLEEGVIRIVAVATPFDLGYQVVALLGIQLDQSKLVGIANDLVQFPEVRFAGVTAGSYDILAEVWFQSTDELVSFITGRLKTIPGVERVESIQVLKLLKYAYDWGVQPSARLSAGPQHTT